MKIQGVMFAVLVSLNVCVIADSGVRDIPASVRLLDDAWSNGADGKNVFHVVDDEGNPVAGVRCAGWVRLFSIKEGGYSYHAETDTNGIVTIAGKCSESFSAFFTKDGYYTSQTEVFLDASNSEPIIVGGKWQPYGETRTVVLKKIRNPGTCVIPKQGGQFTWNIPAFGEWIGFDFEDFDWTTPYGCGKSTDILLKFQGKSNKRFIDYEYEMDVCFTNYPYAGAYVCDLDKYSDLEIPYCADTNGEFRTSFHFVMKKSPVQRITECVEEDQCLVFRTRTALDDNGNLKTAHYGVIVGMWGFGGKQMGVGDACFNIIENDVNVEDGRTLRDKIKNYKKSK